ncbi:hypothetical protein OTSKATO_1480 [Orientia tsutsugamushi str. Kato PP]|uniref:Uncharacterized protein n=1 Tax=Orientia tsutsugamushi TaxID=784 RepID=A0A2U3R143_ORITS|nr:hypothetical protein OTSKATO_1480 [Orientia tsutsugamushi str. Kato PP]SPR06899.1 Uncharacterised protein [Orientia tsutsugamushi]
MRFEHRKKQQWCIIQDLMLANFSTTITQAEIEFTASKTIPAHDNISKFSSFGL